MQRWSPICIALIALAGCAEDDNTSNTSNDTNTGGTVETSDSTNSTDTQTADSETNSETNSDTNSDTTATSGDCAAPESEIESVVCAAQVLYDTLSEDEQAAILYDFSDATAKTTWSNLPNASRNGLMFGNLSEDSLAAVMALASTVLSEEGYIDFVGVLAADDYLNEQGGSGGMGGSADLDSDEAPADLESDEAPADLDADEAPDNTDFAAMDFGGGAAMGGGGGGLSYSSQNYYVAFIGSPSVSGDWMLQLGGHHMAYNITYTGGVGYPTPHHLGTEPKGEFTINSETYEPLGPEGRAFVSLFESMTADQITTAFLADEAYADVLLGPDNGSGVAASDYPAGDNRTGVLVANLDADQQALVTAAIEQWVGDYHSILSTPLLEQYTGSSAYADTYVAWAGTEASGPDPDVGGTYFRIDGPELWIEVACQNGVVIQGETHYHTIFRDKATDYAGLL